jgi:hypothetical protein
MTTVNLPPFLRNLIELPPPAGDGHNWLFRVARPCHRYLPAADIIALLTDHPANSGGRFSKKEIEDAVRNSITSAWQPKNENHGSQRWPAVNRVHRDAIIREGGGMAHLWDLSPVQIADDESRAEVIIERIFPDDCLLCCGKSNSSFDTKPLDDWRDELASLSLIVPSPMSSVTGTTKDGRESKHALSNTASRRFLICEFDTGKADDHASLLVHLAEYAPLVCAVHSGNKSLHGWFFVHGQPEDKVFRFFHYAVSLGADRATWTRSQFVRMPDGCRDNGKRQTVFYLNFKPLGAA